MPRHENIGIWKDSFKDFLDQLKEHKEIEGENNEKAMKPRNNTWKKNKLDDDTNDIKKQCLRLKVLQ